LWETAIKQIDAGDSAFQKSHTKKRKRYSNCLTILYFDAAVAASKAGLDAAFYTTKLKALSVVTETSADDEDAFHFYGAGHASMLWGRWLRDYQHAEKATWRKCFRARALEEMDMLDDDDASNDTRGLHALAVTLLEADDRVNAGAIFAILFRPLEHLLTQKVIEDGNIDCPGSEEISHQITDDDRERAQSGNLTKTQAPSVVTKSTDNRLPSDIISKESSATRLSSAAIWNICEDFASEFDGRCKPAIFATKKYAWSAKARDFGDIDHEIFCSRAVSYETGARGIYCNRLTDRCMKWGYLNPGMMMLHELVHWNYIGNKAIEDMIVYLKQTDKTKEPSRGYEPWNAIQVNKIYGTGSYNADNYAWYAMEAFLLQNPAPYGCGGNKLDPPLGYFVDPMQYLC
jgi:hypothetical protein